MLAEGGPSVEDGSRPGNEYGRYAPSRESNCPVFPRYSDQSLDWRTRLVGMGGTAAIATMALAGALFTWRIAHHVPPAPTVVVMELLNVAAAPEPVREVPEGPQQDEQRERKPEKPDPPEIVPPSPSQTPSATAAEPPVEQSSAADPVPQTTAPRSFAAPPASRMSSDAEATWEGKLLAHLGKFRRYPAAARARREQGVVHVRFRMDRQGNLLFAEIARSSGLPNLDRAALETVRRAQPLPPIPADRPDPLELSVPIEFFVRN